MTQPALDEQHVKQIMLEVVARYADRGSQFQANSVLGETAGELKVGHAHYAAHQAILTVWYDLFRTGIISWGLNLDNPNPPFCHLTARGAAVMAQLSRDPSNQAGYLAQTVLDQLAAEIDQRQGSMPKTLKEEYSAYWPAFTGQIRMARNDAGHPTSIAPVTADTVHASLLIFPQLAKLSLQLLDWIKTAV